MLFNILSCILFLIVSTTGTYAVFTSHNAGDERNLGASWFYGIVFTLIFMWVMTWQNWWR